jgi:3-methyladenine DNA glycosylase AlkD
LEFASAAAWKRSVLALWRGAQFREERYAALILAGHRAAREWQTMDALPMYERIIVQGAWWDIVDDVATHRLLEILEREPLPMKQAMRTWSNDGDLWKRRSSILCQIGAKQRTDVRLLFDCIAPSLASREFFLAKAIGWALRQYAATDPDKVRRYVKEHERELSPLSKREALKNITRSRGPSKIDGR